MEYGCLPIANVEEVFLLHFLVKVIPYTVEMDGCFFFLHMGNNECIFQNGCSSLPDPKMIAWVSQALRVQNTLSDWFEDLGLVARVEGS